MLTTDPAALLPQLHAVYEAEQLKTKLQQIVDICARYGLRLPTDQSGKPVPTSVELAQAVQPARKDRARSR